MICAEGEVTDCITTSWLLIPELRVDTACTSRPARSAFDSSSVDRLSFPRWRGELIAITIGIP